MNLKHRNRKGSDSLYQILKTMIILFIRTGMDLHDYVKDQITTDKKYYLFLMKSRQSPILNVSLIR